MKIRIWFPLLLLLMQAPLTAGAVQRVRARPVLKADREYNAILLHVAQYFVLTIPDGKTIADIDHAISCTFVISPDGALRQLEIENELEGMGNVFSGSAARRTETWLRDAVLTGMQGVPPFDMSRIRSRSDKKRTVVFSFGQTGGGEATRIPSMGFNSNIVDANVNQSVEEQLAAARAGKSLGDAPGLGLTRHESQRRYLAGSEAWEGFTNENIKSTMKPKFDPHRNAPAPVLPQQPQRPLPTDSLPHIDIAITLQ